MHVINFAEKNNNPLNVRKNKRGEEDSLLKREIGPCRNGNLYNMDNWRKFV